jgi:hypothetical protein
VSALPAQTIGGWLLDVGIQWRPGYRRLTTDDVYHLVFPNEYLAHPQPLWLGYWHPTWAEPDPQFAFAVFEGRSETVCTLCMQPLRRLLLLDPPVGTLGIASRDRIDIAYCDTCTGAETSFHHHADDGAPTLISAPYAVFPFQGEPRPAVRVGLTNLGPRWARQEWGSSNGRQNLNRLGGEPAWIQQPDYPSCPSCDTLMMHIGQLEWDHLDNGEGMSYIFWCDTCAVSALTYQQA